MKNCIYIIWLITSLATAQTLKEVPSPYDLGGGQLIHFPEFPSKNITSRAVDVWLPKNYTERETYKVIYMHDGQMLFDAKTTWNQQEWGVDEWGTQLQINKETSPFIVVGIHNNPELRWNEYFPEQAIKSLTNKKPEEVQKLLKSHQYNRDLMADNYLKFLVEELKPFIDKRFSVSPYARDTFVMGSSMGGLISLYAVCKYPGVFGGAACLSTHWPGAHIYDNDLLSEILFDFFEANIPVAGFHKFYFDYGDQTLDKYYPKYAPILEKLMESKGYSESNFIQIFIEGANHSENAWRARLDQPLTFLLQP